MSYRTEISRVSPLMPDGGGDKVQVLGHWGPHRDTTVTDSDGSLVTVRNDTWVISLGAIPTASTVVIADGSTNTLIPGNIYEITVAGGRLAHAAYFNIEWSSKAGSTPAPAIGDWAWSFGVSPAWVFTAKEGQEKLSLLLTFNGEGVGDTFGSAANYVQVRRLI